MKSDHDRNVVGDVLSPSVLFATDRLYSSHGVQYTPLQSESVNVKMVKYGLDSASYLRDGEKLSVKALRTSIALKCTAIY